MGRKMRVRKGGFEDLCERDGIAPDQLPRAGESCRRPAVGRLLFVFSLRRFDLVAACPKFEVEVRRHRTAHFEKGPVKGSVIRVRMDRRVAIVISHRPPSAKHPLARSRVPSRSSIEIRRAGGSARRPPGNAQRCFLPASQASLVPARASAHAVSALLEARLPWLGTVGAPTEWNCDKRRTAVAGVVNIREQVGSRRS